MHADVRYVYLKMDGQLCASEAEADIVAEHVDFGDDGPVLPNYRVRDKNGSWKEFASTDLTEIKQQVRTDKENFDYN